VDLGPAFANSLSAFANSVFANSAFANSAFDFMVTRLWEGVAGARHDPHDEKGEKLMCHYGN
jgi:hypothetical protein